MEYCIDRWGVELQCRAGRNCDSSSATTCFFCLVIPYYLRFSTSGTMGNKYVFFISYLLSGLLLSGQKMDKGNEWSFTSSACYDNFSEFCMCWLSSEQKSSVFGPIRVTWSTWGENANFDLEDLDSFQDFFLSTIIFLFLGNLQESPQWHKVPTDTQQD